MTCWPSMFFTPHMLACKWAWRTTHVPQGMPPQTLAFEHHAACELNSHFHAGKPAACTSVSCNRPCPACCKRTHPYHTHTPLQPPPLAYYAPPLSTHVPASDSHKHAMTTAVPMLAAMLPHATSTATGDKAAAAVAVEKGMWPPHWLQC